MMEIFSYISIGFLLGAACGYCGALRWLRSKLEPRASWGEFVKPQSVTQATKKVVRTSSGAFTIHTKHKPAVNDDEACYAREIEERMSSR